MAVQQNPIGLCAVHRGIRTEIYRRQSRDIAAQKIATHNCRRGGAIVGDLMEERDLMKKLVLALGVVCAAAFTAGSASAFPGGGGLIDALSNQNMIQDVQYCRRGAYWCPGRISGCCPVGWACGSTTCYRSANRSTPAARTNKVPGR
jgi:hypothetical protein